MTDEQKHAIDHAKKVLRGVKLYGHAEILSASKPAEPAATTINLIIRDVCESEPGDITHVDTLCIGVEYLRDILERRLERAALPSGKVAQAEPVAWKVDGLNGCNESSPGVWLKKVNADEAAAMLFKSSVTPLYAAPQKD